MLGDQRRELGGWALPWDTGRQEELAPDVVALARSSSPALRPPEAVELDDALDDTEALEQGVTGAG